MGHDLWHGRARNVGPYDRAMFRLDAATGAGIFSTLMSVVVGVPVLMSVEGNDDLLAIPIWMWVTAYALLLAAQIAITWVSWLLTRPAQLMLYGTSVVLGPVIVLGAPSAGWLPIILVLTAAIGCYLVSGRAVAAIIVMHTVVIGLAAGVQNPAIFNVVFSALVYAVIQTATSMSVFATIREARTRQELAVAHAELKAATVALAQTSRSAERLRIARDLHDAVGHQLTSLALELEVASHAPDKAATHVDRSRAIARDLLAEVRAVVSDLRLHSPDLRTAIEAMVDGLPDLDVQLTVEDTLVLDEEHTLTLMRCVQEVVTNTIRHAQATSLTIEVTRHDDRILLSTQDNGVARGQVRVGNGLSIIRERAQELGGSAHFAADNGFQVKVKVPLP